MEWIAMDEDDNGLTPYRNAALDVIGDNAVALAAPPAGEAPAGETPTPGDQAWGPAGYGGAQGAAGPIAGPVHAAGPPAYLQPDQAAAGGHPAGHASWPAWHRARKGSTERC